jgi:hypothetical protein
LTCHPRGYRKVKFKFRLHGSHRQPHLIYYLKHSYQYHPKKCFYSHYYRFSFFLAMISSMQAASAKAALATSQTTVSKLALISSTRTATQPPIAPRTLPVSEGVVERISSLSVTFRIQTLSHQCANKVPFAQTRWTLVSRS